MQLRFGHALVDHGNPGGEILGYSALGIMFIAIDTDQSLSISGDPSRRNPIVGVDITLIV